MTEVDTSSYPRAQLPVQQSPLDIAGKLQGLQAGSLDIDQRKLNQANQALGYMTRAMSSLGPDATKDQYAAVAQNAVKMGLVPQNMLNTYMERLQAAPTSRQFYDEFVTAAAGHQETLNYHLGQPGMMSTGNAAVPITQSQKFGVHSTGAPIATQLPVTAPTVDAEGRPMLRGPAPSEVPPGMVAAPPRIDADASLPVGPYDPGRVPGMRPGERAISAQVQPPQPNYTGMSPGFEEGLKQRTADQDLATNKMTAIKPLLLAYPKMLDLERSGPGTQTWNDSVAFLKTWGIIPTQTNGKDQTQVYQEINKYMNQYISRGGNRSDSEQAQKEMSNPNVTKQILPALKELTAKTAGQDRIEAARPGAFEGKDYSKYGEHRSQFPQSVSVDAASLDFMPPSQQSKKFNEMLDKAKKGDSNAIRYIKTLDIMRRQKMHGEMQVTE